MIDWDFHRSAKALVKALNQIRDANGCCGTSPSISSPLELISWVIESRSDTTYLAHPPVLFRSNGCSHHRVDSVTSDEDKLDYSGSIVELDEYESTAYNCNPRHDVTEWTFSVVFHETWRVPTLYFQVHDIDGTPINREEVVSILLNSIRETTGANDANDCMTEEQTWDFVSQEEHPMTGKPSFFLHPCQTATKMELLLHQPNHLCPLLSWMSMILPSVGCTISPIIYHEAQEKMMPPNQSMTDVCKR
jgi:hypothetical protein